MAANPGLSPTSEQAPDPVAIVAEALSLVGEANSRGVVLRLLGGIAVAVRCDRGLGSVPHREFADIDAITRRKSLPALVELLGHRGYEPNQRFNALNWRDRLIFYGPQGKLDVFVESFEMCHRLDLEARLDVDPQTVSASDLLLTKLQVVELTDKDLQDAALLLATHEIGDGDGQRLNAPYLGSLLASDWGLWRTATANLGQIAQRAPDTRARVVALLAEIEAAPKTRRWKARSVVGERKRWYELPEEVG